MKRFTRIVGAQPGVAVPLEATLGRGAGEVPSGGKNWQAFTWLKMGELDRLQVSNLAAKAVDEI